MNVAQQLFKLFLENLPKVFIIIDGLDECEISQRKLLLSFLTEQVGHWDDRETGKLRIMFVSQQMSDIEKALQNATIFGLSKEDNESDIRVFVEARCKDIKSKYRALDMEQMTFIRETTCFRSEGALNVTSDPHYYHSLPHLESWQFQIQGMFLYAKLVMENLYQQETVGNLLVEIRQYGFPNGLEEA